MTPPRRKQYEPQKDGGGREGARWSGFTIVECVTLTGGVDGGDGADGGSPLRRQSFHTEEFNLITTMSIKSGSGVGTGAYNVLSSWDLLEDGP